MTFLPVWFVELVLLSCDSWTEERGLLHHSARFVAHHVCAAAVAKLLVPATVMKNSLCFKRMNKLCAYSFFANHPSTNLALTLG